MQGANGPVNVSIKGRMQQIMILGAIIAVGIMIAQAV